MDPSPDHGDIGTVRSSLNRTDWLFAPQMPALVLCVLEWAPAHFASYGCVAPIQILTAMQNWFQPRPAPAAVVVCCKQDTVYSRSGFDVPMSVSPVQGKPSLSHARCALLSWRASSSTRLAAGEFAASIGAAYCECSAITGRGVNEAVQVGDRQRALSCLRCCIQCTPRCAVLRVLMSIPTQAAVEAVALRGFLHAAGSKDEEWAVQQQRSLDADAKDAEQARSARCTVC